MSEARPVKRRESPWGTPEGADRQPKAHRCNDRAEDVIQAVFEGNPFKTIPGPFKLFWQCMRSKPGLCAPQLFLPDPTTLDVKKICRKLIFREEPTEPFTYLDLEPPKREVKLE